MAIKPTTASGYEPGQVARVKATCLYLATKLGDLMPDLVVVGGLVPSLLIDQENPPERTSAHVGTMDLDLGLAFALVGDQRYQQVAERLRNAGFSPDKNEEGNPTRQRWRIADAAVTVDFLIEPEPSTVGQAGKLFNLTNDWAAIIAPGLHLAFQNNHKLMLTGMTIVGEKAQRQICVCGAGAFVVLKAYAFRIRGENKDAYDLNYLLLNYGQGAASVAAELRPLLADPSAQTAMDYLREDFRERDSVGPRRVAEFLYGRPEENIQADTVGIVRQLISECGI
ncbi:MAG: hypothetical protein ABL888_06780 [Pirellulaceae bacterium]